MNYSSQLINPALGSNIGILVVNVKYLAEKYGEHLCRV